MKQPSGRVGAVNPDGHVIGLDIGATAVRAAFLAPNTIDGLPTVTVHGLGSAPLPPGTVVSGVVKDEAALTAALKKLWQVNKFGCTHVILGIASQQVLVRDIQLPNLSPSLRARALPFQAREIVALPMDEVLLDFAPLGEPDPDTDLVPGLLIATPSQPVLAAVAAVERAGLKVARVDLASFGALRSIASPEQPVEAVIDLGAHLTTIVIHNQGVPRLVRTLARGGDNLTERLADTLSLSIPEAEAAKQDVGLTGGHTAVSAALDDAVKPLLAEIRSSINYFKSGNAGAVLQRISLTGGGSQLQGLVDVMAVHSGIPTAVVTPMQHIRNRDGDSTEAPAESEQWASAVSVGLAMGAVA